MSSPYIWTVYLLRCADNSIYCGVTTNLKKRIDQHNAGKGAKYTRSRRPVYLVASKSYLPKKEAYQLEYKIKRLPKVQKVAFVENL